MFLLSGIYKIKEFLGEARLEAKKVNWPNRKDTVQNTLVVIAFSTTVAIILSLFDFIFTSLLKKFIL